MLGKVNNHASLWGLSCNQARWSNSFLAVSPCRRVLQTTFPHIQSDVSPDSIVCKTSWCAVEGVPLFTFCPVWFRARPPLPARPRKLRRIESQPLGTLAGVFETVNSACFDSTGWRYFWWVDGEKVQRKFTVFLWMLRQAWNATSGGWILSNKMAANNTRWTLSVMYFLWYIIY
mgnify:FL=1